MGHLPTLSILSDMWVLLISSFLWVSDSESAMLPRFESGTSSDVEAILVDLIAQDAQLFGAGLLVAADLFGQE